MTSKTKICLDADAILYRAAAGAEIKEIICKHASGKEFMFKTRTEFYGHYKKKAGGWLSKNSQYKLEEFEIEDIVTPKPLEVMQKSLDAIIKEITERYDTKLVYGYVGGEGNFRKNIATLQEYKGNRNDLVKPFHFQSAKSYIISEYNCKVIDGIEADDAVAMDAYDAHKNKQSLICAAIDKDFNSCVGTWYNFVNRTELIVPPAYGALRLNDKDEPKGYGRVWLYYQILHGDTSDNYSPSVFSDKTSGQMECYNALKDCSDDREAWKAIVDFYKELYPEPKEVTNWKGDTFVIDWLYVLQEITDLAHMMRWDGDRIIVKDVLDRMGITYDS